MGPALLDKKTVNVSLSAQKKKQIDEGVAIATKVDAVRETLREEEANLENFRKNAIAKIQEEINLKNREKSELESQIERRTYELTLLRKPLDAEWLEVAREKESIAKAQEENESTKLELENRLSEVSKREKLLTEEEYRVHNERERSTELLQDADSISQKANGLLYRITSEQNHRENELDAREQKLKEDEKSFSIREKALAASEKKNQKDRKDIERREIVLKDRYATLTKITNKHASTH